MHIPAYPLGETAIMFSCWIFWDIVIVYEDVYDPTSPIISWLRSWYFPSWTTSKILLDVEIYMETYEIPSVIVSLIGNYKIVVES